MEIKRKLKLPIRGGKRLEKLIDALKKIGLSKDQRHDVKDYIFARHGKESWIIPQMNQKGVVTFYIKDEGVRWLHEVYDNLDVSLIDGEIAFEKKRIQELQSELEIWNLKYPKKYRKYQSMNLNELADEFQKSPSAIYKAIKAMEQNGQNEILKRRPTVISAAGVQWIEENIFQKAYLDHLIDYKLQLAGILEGEVHDRKSKNSFHTIDSEGI
jgi:hypothetical protein